MERKTNLQTDDYQSTESRMPVIPRSLSSSSGTPVIVILTPDLNDPVLADVWASPFDKLATQFQVLGVRTVAAPWSTAPLTSDSSHPCTYLVNLAWGYHQLTERWYAWLRAWPQDIKLINSPSLLLWNTRKTYLQDLEKAAVSIIPTLYVEHIDETTLLDASVHFGVSDLIVKPQISASSFNTVRVLLNSTDFSSAPKSMSVTAAVAELRRVGANESSMMIQPFMTSVVLEGEVSVFIFNKKLSHAVRRNTHPDDYRVQNKFGGRTSVLSELSSEMVQLAHAAIAACPETPVYARVDMIRSAITGHWCISELELIEPNLYLDHAPDQGLAFAHAILQAGCKAES